MKRVCHAPRGTSCQCHWMCLSIRKKNIYGLGVGLSMVSEILRFLVNKGGGAWVQGFLAGVTGCVLAYGTRIYMVKGWGSEGFLRY